LSSRALGAYEAIIAEFITPRRHPHSTPWHAALVCGLLVVGIGLALYAVFLQRREQADDREFSHHDPTA
jgi:hypothetical protein